MYMSPEAQEVLSSQENHFVVDRDFIIAHQETVLDFFGDSRNKNDSWYQKLNSPSPLSKRVKLVDSSKIFDLNTSSEEEESTDEIVPPLDLRMMLDKVDDVVTFFAVVPGAKEALKEYYEHERKEKAKVVHPAVDDLYGGAI